MHWGRNKCSSEPHISNRQVTSEQDQEFTTAKGDSSDNIKSWAINAMNAKLKRFLHPGTLCRLLFNCILTYPKKSRNQNFQTPKKSFDHPCHLKSRVPPPRLLWQQVISETRLVLLYTFHLYTQLTGVLMKPKCQ